MKKKLLIIVGLLSIFYLFAWVAVPMLQDMIPSSSYVEIQSVPNRPNSTRPIVTVERNDVRGWQEKSKIPLTVFVTILGAYMGYIVVRKSSPISDPTKSKS